MSNKFYSNNNTKVIIDNFLSSKFLESGSALNTVQAYKRDIKLILDWLRMKKVNFDKVTEKELLNYFAFLKINKYALNSINRKISVIKSFYQFIFDEQIINYNLTSNIKMIKKQKLLPNVLSESEILGLIKQAHENYKNCNSKQKIAAYRLYSILEILYSTGLRISELLSLKVDSLKNIKDKFYIKGKGGTQRLIIFNKKSLEVIKIWFKIRK